MVVSAVAYPAPSYLAQFAPHGVCYGWTSNLLWLHVISDVLTVLAYFTIPIVLLVLWRRRRADLPFHWMFVSFALFILACGATHAIEVWNIWHADYWAAGALKALTAVASVTTAVALIRLLPVLTRLPAPADVERVNQQLNAANARLQASEKMFRTFMDHSPLRCWINDAKGVYLYGNATNEQFFGRGELAGRQFPELFPAELARRFQEEDQVVLASSDGRSVQTEVNLNERQFRVYKFPLQSPSGERLVGGVALDVTEHRHALAGLHDKTELLARVTDALGVYLDQGDWKTAHQILLKCALQQTLSTSGYIGVVVAGPRLRVLANEGLDWGGATPELVGEIGAPEADHGYHEISDFETLPGRVVARGEVLIANGLPPDARDTGLPSMQPALKNFMGVPVFRGKEVVGMIAVGNRAEGYDASAQVQLETLVKQAGVLCDCYRRDLRESALEEQVRVAQKMEAIGLLAGGVAHDFNNLLQVIQGYTAIALDSSTSMPDRFSSLEQVRGAGQRAAQLTQQLLAFSRQQRLQKSDLEVNQAIRDLLRMIERLIGEHIAVDFVPGRGLGNVCADRAQFDQVLLNLCLNARDALPSGGRIAIQTENVVVNHAFRESHPWAKPGRYVLLSVSDNGVGMDKETQARIFEPFFSTKPKGKGTGLGLSVVYGVVKQHDGMVDVHSEPGKGTTFKIYLPIVSRSPNEEGPKSPSAVRRGTETILLAEDDPLVRELAKRILDRAGYHVLVANDGAEACALFAQNAPTISLMVLDVVMPQISGPDAYKRMERIRGGVPVIFCSGYAGSALEGYAFDGPGRRLLAKPYGADELLRSVRAELDQTLGGLRAGS